ncbi:MAG: ATP-binding protein [Deltaproteobacteria bacterium]|nr:ATP-binding protein [Deltaproteobacteria bacterium]
MQREDTQRQTVSRRRRACSLAVPRAEDAGLGKRLDELVRQADAEAWSSIDILDDALSTEVASREASSVRERVREAKFPDVLTLDTFDFELASGVDKKQLLSMARGEFVDDKQNIVFVGPVGTGKTHLATALGVEMARRRLRVTWFRAADLVSALLEAKSAAASLAAFIGGSHGRRCSSSTSSASYRSTVKVVNYSSIYSRRGTVSRRPSLQRTSRFPSGQRSSVATRS